MKKRVGLIGLGLMGAPMGRIWVQKGFALTVLPFRKREAAEELQKLGATIAVNLEELVSRSDMIALMVPTSLEVGEICAALKNLCRPQHLVVDMSTSDPQSTVKIHEDFKTKGLRFFDSPVTGGVKGATDGALTLFVGGPENWFEEARETLAAVSRVQTHFGKAGSGHVAKLINNFVCIGNLAVFAEALPLAARLGLEPRKLFETLQTGMAGSRQLDAYVPQILEGDFAPRFKLAHAFKDMNLAQKLAESLGVKLPVLEGIVEEFKEAHSRGLDEENLSALIKVVESALGTAYRR